MLRPTALPQEAEWAGVFGESLALDRNTPPEVTRCRDRWVRDVFSALVHDKMDTRATAAREKSRDSSNLPERRVNAN